MSYHWAIVGLGTVAEEFATAITQANLPIYAVQSRSQEKGEAFAKRFQIPKVYSSYQELLEDPAIDIIYLATPHAFHYQMIKEALQHQKHVFCEKAITIDAKELTELIEISKENQCLLAEGTTIFYMPLYQKLKEYQPQLGKLKMIQANFGSFKEDKEDNRFFSLKDAGGALLDIGPYAFGICQYFMTSSPKVFSSTVEYHPSGVDESSCTILKNDHEELASINLTFRAKMPKRAIIAFEKGYLTIDDYPRAASATFTTPEGTNYLIETKDTTHAFVHEYQTMNDWLEQGIVSSPFISDVLQIMQLFDECRQQWK